MKNQVILDTLIDNIAITDNNEPLVNLRDYSKIILIDLENSGKKEQRISDDECYVRESVAIMLSRAQSLLPNGIFLKIIEGFRSISQQKKLFNSVMLKIKRNNPNMNSSELIAETSKFIANPNSVPPHTTGGAVDLTLADKNKRELKMGTKVNSLSKEASTYNESIDKEAKKNRALLIKVMEKAGFVNYPLEWWHWSYGDQYWAAVKKKKQAIYNIRKSLRFTTH